MTIASIASLRDTLAATLRDKARRLFLEADALRREADALDLAGLEAQHRAYELEGK